jgi:hypothetical protein
VPNPAARRIPCKSLSHSLSGLSGGRGRGEISPSQGSPFEALNRGVGQAFQPAGAPDFPVRGSKRATGKSPAPADRNVRPTRESDPRLACRIRRPAGFPAYKGERSASRVPNPAARRIPCKSLLEKVQRSGFNVPRSMFPPLNSQPSTLNRPPSPALRQGEGQVRGKGIHPSTFILPVALALHCPATPLVFPGRRGKTNEAL